MSAFATSRTTVRRNAISAYLPLVVSTLLGLFLTPVFVHALTREDFGLWSVGLGLISYLGILDAGVGTAIATRTGHSVDDVREIERTARTASVIYTIMGSLCVVLGGGLAVLLPEVVGHDSAANVQLMVGLLAVWQALNLLTIVPSGLLQGTGNFSSYALFGALAALVLGVSQAVAAIVTHEIAWVAGATAVSGAVAFTLAHARARSRVPGYVFSFRGADRQMAWSLYRLGWRNSLVFIAGTAGYGSDVLIVGLVAGADAAAIYAIASRAGQFALMFGLRAADSMTGSYATLSGLGAYSRIWGLYRRGVQFSVTVYLPLAVALVVFGHGLLVLWVGELGGDSYAALAAIAAAGLFRVVGHNAFVLIVAAEQTTRIIRLSAFSAVVNIVSTVLLVQQIGPAGAALGSLVTAALIDGIGLPIVAARICGARARTIVTALTPAVGPLVAAGAVSVLFRWAFGQESYAAVAGTIVTVAAFGLTCVATSKQRAALAQLVGRDTTSR